jgi:protein tyrosine/serine phosphatase
MKKTTSTPTCFALLIAFMTTISACGAIPDGPFANHLASDRHTAAPSQDPTIRNFQKVNDRLFRSGRLTEANYANLAERGINTVISFEEYLSSDISLEQESSWAKRNKIRLLHHPISDSKGPTLAQIEAVLAELNKPENGIILVHCHRGADRTGIIIGSYRIRFNGFSVEAAIQEMRKYGHARNLYWWDEVLYDVAGEPRPRDH